MDKLELFIKKMIRNDQPRAAIETFGRYYRQIDSGTTGLVPESHIEPIDPGGLPDFEQLNNTITG